MRFDRRSLTAEGRLHATVRVVVNVAVFTQRRRGVGNLDALVETAADVAVANQVLAQRACRAAERERVIAARTEGRVGFRCDTRRRRRSRVPSAADFDGAPDDFERVENVAVCPRPVDENGVVASPPAPTTRRPRTVLSALVILNAAERRPLPSTRRVKGRPSKSKARRQVARRQC